VGKRKEVNPDAPDWTDPLVILPDEAYAHTAKCHCSVEAVVIENLGVPASCGQQPALSRLGCQTD